MKRRFQGGGMRPRTGRRSIKSMYVDYGFPEVGDIRRERYLENFYTTEAMRDQANKLRSLPQDDPLRMQILGATDQVLNEISKRGDYENMTTAVSRANTEYNKLAAPISKNLELYTAYQDKLKKDYDEGRLKYEDYMGTMAMSDAYTGLQMDESGNVSNYFQGVTPVYDPDIPNLIYDALNTLVPDKTVIKGQKLAQGPDGKYAIKTTDGITYVDAARVDSVMNLVMQDPAVTAYLRRRVQIDTFQKTPYQIQGEIARDLQGLQYNIDSLDATIAGTTDEEAKAYLEQQKEGLIRGIGGLQEVANRSSFDGPNGVLEGYQQHLLAKENARYRQSAEDKYTYEQTEQERTLSYDAAYLKRLDKDLAKTPLPKFTVLGRGLQYQSQYGASDYEVVKNMNSINDQILQMRQEWDQESSTWSPQLKQKWNQSMFSLMTELDNHAQILSQQYGIDSASEVYQREGYQAAVKRYEDAVQAYKESLIRPSGVDTEMLTTSPGAQAASMGPSQAAWQNVQATEQELRDFLKNNGQLDPDMGRRTINPTLHSIGDLGLEEQVGEYLNSRFMTPPNLNGYSEVSNDIIDIPTLLGEGKWKLSDVGVMVSGFIPGNISDRVLGLTYVDQDNTSRSHEIYVPITQTGISAQELGIQVTTFDMYMGEIERMRNEIPGKEYRMSVYQQGRGLGTIVVEFGGDPNGKDDKVYTIFDGEKSKKTGLLDGSLQDAFEEGVFTSPADFMNFR